MSALLNKKLTHLQSLGTQRAPLLRKELGLHTYADLLYYFPLRYEDRTRFYTLQQIHPNMPFIQVQGQLGPLKIHSTKAKKILTATFQDTTSTIKLVWFNRIHWHLKQLIPKQTYLLWGKPTHYQHKTVIIHPELRPLATATPPTTKLQPIYRTTQTLTKCALNSKAIARLQKSLWQEIKHNLPENIPHTIRQTHALMPRKAALQAIHFPNNHTQLSQAQQRIKFEQIFYQQLHIRQQHTLLMPPTTSYVFDSPQLVHTFYKQLPFQLTNAQKRVIKTIFKDMKSGQQMHRLLQGDVGSGKTITAFISMLFPIAHQAQAALVAPTEILAQQHYTSLQSHASKLDLQVALLTGATKQRHRKDLQQKLIDGTIHILIGTHALFQQDIQFQKLGLVVIDEQHRFGVAQRATMHHKKGQAPPHILVMTATPIPRTLAMALYSHLDISVLDELPPNRLPVKTYHAHDKHRLRILGFIRKQINTGRQVYVVYPRIESSPQQPHKDLIDGYESMQRAFPHIHCSILHGRMKPQDKAYEMNRFLKGETKIMVSSTVIEVGVNVPNATLMIIENAENFGLAQLHQLRGRIVRGTHQPYCILVTKENLNPHSQKRIQTMVQTNDGFKIATIDMALRGHGQLQGTAQSGLAHTHSLVDYTQDHTLIHQATQAVKKLLQQDPQLSNPAHAIITQHLHSLSTAKKDWSQVS